MEPVPAPNKFADNLEIAVADKKNLLVTKPYNAAAMTSRHEIIGESRSCHHARLYEKTRISKVCHMAVSSEVQCVCRIMPHADTSVPHAFSADELRVLSTKGPEPIYTIKVTGIKSDHGDDGKYFNFSPKDMIALSGATWQRLVVVENVRSGFKGTVILWPTPGKSGLTEVDGLATGRINQSPKAGDFVINDVLSIYAKSKLPDYEQCEQDDNYACEAGKCVVDKTIDVTTKTGFTCASALAGPQPTFSICNKPYHMKWYPEGDMTGEKSCVSGFCDCWTPLKTRPGQKPICKCAEKKRAPLPCSSGQNAECLSGVCQCVHHQGAGEIDCHCATGGGAAPVD
jgi:hypothetical protein